MRIAAYVRDDLAYIKWRVHKIEYSIAQLSQVEQVFDERLQKLSLLDHHLAELD